VRQTTKSIKKISNLKLFSSYLCIYK